MQLQTLYKLIQLCLTARNRIVKSHILSILLYLQHWQLIYNIQQKISLLNWKMPPVQTFQGKWLVQVLLTSFLLHNQELYFLMGVPGSNLQTKCIQLQFWKKTRGPSEPRSNAITTHFPYRWYSLFWRRTLLWRKVFWSSSPCID